MYCGECGEEVAVNAKYCDDCGAEVNAEIDISSLSESPTSESRLISKHPTRISRSNRHEPAFPTIIHPTAFLSRVIVLNYVVLAVFVILLLIIIRYSSFTAFIFGLLAFFVFWINDGLKEYDNFRRKIYLSVLAISFLISIFYSASLAVILGAYAAIIFLVLAFHTPTIKLFL